MPDIIDVEFEYEKGMHCTITHTSGNPGNTHLSQYWLNIKLSDKTTLRINLKNDFRDIFEKKRITSGRRDEIKKLIQSKKCCLMGIVVEPQIRNFHLSRTEWQNGSHSFDKHSYKGLDEISLKKIRGFLENGLRSIVK